MSAQIITLRDPKSGAAAKILPGFGFNCFSFVAAPAGEPIEVLWSAPNFESGKERPSHSGIPILFPYPGRLRGKSLTYQGRTYPLEGDDGRGNAIHGYVLNRPWRVLEQTELRAVAEFMASRDEPGLLEKWPSDFLLRVSYEVSGNALSSQLTVSNPGKANLPFGLGTHPYFRVPLGKTGSAAECVVTVPAAEYWELADMLPTGQRVTAAGRYGLARGLKFAELQLDDMFTGLTSSSGRTQATVADPRSGRTLMIEFDAIFRECIVYNPPHREAICLEPYTCVPDYFNVQGAGIESGLHVLTPGESIAGKIDIRLD